MKNQLSENVSVRPFLRWAGGKKWLLPQIKHMIPRFDRYFEPFLGSGAVFFYLHTQYQGKHFFLSDINQPLINTYKQLKYNYKKVLRYLKIIRNTRIDYYKIRSKITDNPVYEAARFIYLNKTCFNGLYRVNKRGIFNVPYGRNFNKIYFDENKLFRASKALKKVNIDVGDFELILREVKKGDFVFLDPPYTVSHKNNGFIEYNETIFSWEDQQRLAKCVELISTKGARFILTNAAHERIEALYNCLGKRVEVERISTISGHLKNRKKISEYIYTNCI